MINRTLEEGQEIAEYTARHFDEFILDDFYKANVFGIGKGTELYYLGFLITVSATSRTTKVCVNPQVKIIIKYPNWYEHFRGLVLTRNKTFDVIYSGTKHVMP